MAVALPVQMLLFSLFLLPISVFAQNNGGVAVGSYLTASTGASSSWLSPSGDFAFGFSPLGNNDFLLSIWYAKIPETVVWHAYEDNKPVTAPGGSILNLIPNGGLVLNNPQGVEIWKSDTNSGIVANGVMNDTGNFVLQDKNSVSLWETFSYPTDTVLPGQNIERNGKLSSRQSETNYTKGRFQLILQDDGNLVLYNVNLTDNAKIHYFDTETTKGALEGSQGKQLVFNSSGYMFVLRENGGRFDLTGPQGFSARDNYIRATLDFDGIFALYSHPKILTGNPSWSSPLWHQPDDICQALGVRVCGNNNTCKLQPDPRPTCECSKGFSFLDPKDIYQGCKPEKQKSRKFVILVATSIFVIVVLSSALCLRFFFNFRKKIVRPSTDTFVDSNLRSLGYEPSTNTVLDSNLRSLGYEPSTDTVLDSNLRTFSYEDSNLRSFSYKELDEATNGFGEELGSGAFGVVFKGVMQIGSSVKVAVKKLNCVGGPSEDVEEQFKTELEVIGRTHHKNLVRLYGFCHEGQQRLLVYEFLSNGTLESFLFYDTKPSWKRRIEIARGVAQGLLYLHEECHTQIVHCDIKPQNILLDNNYTARISDFGLAKRLPMNQDQILSAHRGTPGYAAPEWRKDVPITTEVDVYSYGVVLLEIICCRRMSEMEGNCEGSASFTDWVYDCYRKGVLDVVVNREAEALGDRPTLEKFVMVAIWCIQEVPSLRHPMRKVVEMLKGDVEVPNPQHPKPYTR